MTVNMWATSTLVNIEIDRYAAALMPRLRTVTPDPDLRLLSALADPTRLAIVRQLVADAETCACDFTACCDVGQPTVSHHLRVLREAGVVTSQRRGQWIYYRLAGDVSRRLAILARDLVPVGLIALGDQRRVSDQRHGSTAATPAVAEEIRPRA